MATIVSPDYVIQRQEGKGRGMVALHKLDPKDCILEESPVVAILDNSSLENTCYNCFAIKGRPFSYRDCNPHIADKEAKTKFLRCGGCGIAKYCDKVRLRYCCAPSTPVPDVLSVADAVQMLI